MKILYYILFLLTATAVISILKGVLGETYDIGYLIGNFFGAINIVVIYNLFIK